MPMLFLTRLLPGMVLVALIAGLYYLGYTHGGSSVEANWQAKLVAQENEALKQQAIMEVKTNEIRDQLQADKRSISGKLAAATFELRNRAETRLPDASRAACAGATGAELSKSDATVLVGIGADADGTVGNLKACIAYIEVVRGKRK